MQWKREVGGEKPGKSTFCSNYRVKIDAVGIKNLKDLANRNSSVTVRTLIH